MFPLLWEIAHLNSGAESEFIHMFHLAQSSEVWATLWKHYGFFYKK